MSVVCVADYEFNITSWIVCWNNNLYMETEKMITEKELKDRCTPEFIKLICELAEGFEYNDKKIEIETPTKNHSSTSLKTLCDQFILHLSDFPLLIHRAVEGWNKKQNDRKLYIEINNNAVWKMYNYEFIKCYMIINYQSENLTQCECALLHCLLDIFEGK